MLRADAQVALWLLACAAVALAFERPLRTLLGVDTKGRAPARLLAEAAALIDRHGPAMDGARGRAAEANAALPLIRQELVPWLLGRADPLRDRYLPAPQRRGKKKTAKRKAASKTKRR